MQITKDDVLHVARLARLRLAEDETQRLAEDMTKILSYVEKLGELDTEGVEPTSHVVGMDTPFREDVVTNEPRPDDAVGGAPRRNGDYFVVPTIIE